MSTGFFALLVTPSLRSPPKWYVLGGWYMPLAEVEIDNRKITFQVSDKVWPIFDSAQSKDFFEGITSELEAQRELPRRNYRVSSLANCYWSRPVWYSRAIDLYIAYRQNSMSSVYFLSFILMKAYYTLKRGVLQGAHRPKEVASDKCGR